MKNFSVVLQKFQMQMLLGLERSNVFVLQQSLMRELKKAAILLVTRKLVTDDAKFFY